MLVSSASPHTYLADRRIALRNRGTFSLPAGGRRSSVGRGSLGTARRARHQSASTTTAGPGRLSVASGTPSDTDCRRFEGIPAL